MNIILDGYVDENGQLTLGSVIKLPPGKVRVEITPQPMASTLEEVKTWFQDIEKNGLPDAAWEESEQALERLLDSAEETGLPADYADELDHYLHGLPKRSSSSEVEEN